MKAKWVLSSVGIVFTVGALMVVFSGNVELQPLRVLNPSNFARSEEIGAITFRRFWQEFHQEKLFIVGSSPYLKNYAEVWRGLIAVAKENNIVFDKVFEQEGLRELGSDSEPIDWAKIQLALISNKKVLVHVVATDEMWSQAVENTTGGLILFQSVLPLTDNEKNLMNSACDAVDKKFQLGCHALKALNLGKKKKFDPEQITAVIERHGKREYLMFVHEK